MDTKHACCFFPLYTCLQGKAHVKGSSGSTSAFQNEQIEEFRVHNTLKTTLEWAPSDAPLLHKLFQVVFMKYDTDKSGAIDSKELQDAFLQFGHSVWWGSGVALTHGSLRTTRF